MASGTSETLSPRQEALRLLERGRAEMSAEARWLRDRVNPKEALRRGVENHPALLIGGGLALGLIATLLLVRPKHPQHVRDAVARHGAASAPVYVAPRASLGGQVVGQLVHMLFPLVVLPVVENFIKSRLRPNPQNP